MGTREYLENYVFDWSIFDVVMGGVSTLDSNFVFSRVTDKDQVTDFLKGYGPDPTDPVNQAELFGNFQEALQFIKRYFLKEGSEDGLDFTIPNSLYMITDVRELFLMASGQKDVTREEKLWAEIVLKVMHTILHVDKDLRSNYFNAIQTQIFDRFYKFLHRDKENNLYLRSGDKKIPLVDFETKAKKSRDSVIIKLLHKAENVAEELFDRVGVRFVTKTKFDILLVTKFLVEHSIVIPHNIKPSRSVNTIIALDEFRKKYSGLVKMAIRNDLSEERFLSAVNRELLECLFTEKNSERNVHTSTSYKSVQFTCRQLVRYKNPFLKEFMGLRKLAKEKGEEDELAKKVLSLDASLIAKDIRFFYPFEVQVVDEESHKINSEGEASHMEYKRTQKLSAQKRVFRDLIEYRKQFEL